MFANVSDLLPNSVRILLLWDKQPNGVSATVADFLSQTGSGANMLVTHYDAQRRHRFQFLWDFVVNLPGHGTTQGNGPSAFQTFKYYKRVNMMQQYDADSDPAVVGDISTGNLMLFMVAGQTSSDPSVAFESRLRFKD